jgi:hypothetical protein
MKKTKFSPDSSFCDRVKSQLWYSLERKKMIQLALAEFKTKNYIKHR